MELRPPADQQARKIKLQNPFGICSGDGAFIDAPYNQERPPVSLEHSPTRAHRRFGRIPVATAESGLSRSALYGLAARYKGLFKKAGSATIVDLNMLGDIIAELPDADINVSDTRRSPTPHRNGRRSKRGAFRRHAVTRHLMRPISHNETASSSKPCKGAVSQPAAGALAAGDFPQIGWKNSMTLHVLHRDIERFGPLDLRVVGAHR